MARMNQRVESLMMCALRLPPVFLCFLLALTLCYVSSSHAGQKDAPPQHSIAISYPMDGSVFPRNIVAPTFLWEDPAKADLWRITVRLPEGRTLATAKSTQPQWRPTATQWETVRLGAEGKAAEVVIQGCAQSAQGDHLSEGSVRIHVSAREVIAPVFYRDVPLPFIIAQRLLHAVQWKIGVISSDDPPKVVLENFNMCGNCHSFTADGRTLAMDVDYGGDKGAYIITDINGEVLFEKENIISWGDYRSEDNHATFGLLSQISPDGRYVISTVRERAVQLPAKGMAYSQLFFPIQGILVVYDRERKTFAALPGADDPAFVQSNPVWSPDGRDIVFTRADADEYTDVHEKYVVEGRKFRYDLYRIPFNDGKGGNPEPLPGASANGRSNFFPKYSPDGKWIVFCQADSYMLLQADSALYLMPAEGGTPRRMRCNMDGLMNSWHSWSPDSRWLVFASKARGPYTQLWLTHVDERGNDSPPVLLEQFMRSDRAANIPEFVNIAPNELAVIRSKLGADNVEK